MTLEQLFDYIDIKTNKNQSGKTLTADNRNTLLLTSNIEQFKRKYGLPEEFVPGRALPSQYWEAVQQNTDDLHRFKVALDGLVNPVFKFDKNGVAQLPSDYVHHSSLNHNMALVAKCKTSMRMRPIEIMKDNQWGSRVGSVLKKPTFKNPIAKIQDNYIQVAPVGITMAHFTYLRLPNTPFYDYNIIDDTEVYLPPGGVHDGSVLPASTPSRSVELEWPEDNHVDIANIILSAIGVNLREGVVYQDAEKHKQTGK